MVIIGEGDAYQPLTSFHYRRWHFGVNTDYFAGSGQLFAAEVNDDVMSAEHFLAGDLA